MAKVDYMIQCAGITREEEAEIRGAFIKEMLKQLKALAVRRSG
jgi:1,2-phenylacetyl-CoA epoxidase catalytic subunit